MKIVFANRTELHLAPSDILTFLEENQAPPEMIKEFVDILDKLKNQKLEINKISTTNIQAKNGSELKEEIRELKSLLQKKINRIKDLETQRVSLSEKVANQKIEIQRLSSK